MASRRSNQDSTQPTLPPEQTYPQTPTTPSTTPPNPQVETNLIPQSIQDNIYSFPERVGDKYQYAIGVSGRRVFDQSGKLREYQGYKYTQQIGSQQMVKEPKYFQGDDDLILGFDIETVANLQRALSQVGYLSKDYPAGVVDDSTKNAFRRILEVANFSGETYEDALIRLASAGAGRRGSLQQYRVTNPDDVKAVINNTSERILGRRLGAGDLDRMARLYLEEERRAGLSQSAQVMAAPNMQVFAEEQIEETMGEETTARRFGSYMEAIKGKYGL